MTLATTDSRFSYDGDGVTTAFSFPRKVIEAAHLDVYLYDEDDASMTLQTLNTHYTFSGTGLSNGIYASATITFVTAPGTDKKVIIYRDPTLTQEADFTGESNVLNALNRFADRVEMKLQRLADRLSRALTLPDGDYASSWANTYAKEDYASALQGFDASGNPMPSGGSSGDVAVSAAMTPVVQSATLEDAADNFDWSISGPMNVTARSLRERLGDMPFVDDFISGSDGGDDALMIQRTVDYYAGLATRGRIIYFRPRRYECESGLTLSGEGITFQGQGVTDMWFPSAWGRAPTELYFNHTNGDAIRCKRGATIKDLRVASGAARAVASAGTNYGIRFEADDTADAGERVNFPRLENVHVIEQPNHGVAVIGNTVGAYLDQVTVTDCGGHGITLDRGDQTGRTNKSRPGLATLINCRTNDNVGHGLCIGHPNNSTSLPIRVFILNTECYRNALSAGVRHTAHDGFIFAEDTQITGGAFAGYDASATNHINSGLWLGGRNNTIRHTRLVGTDIPLTVGVQSGLTTDGITIDNIHISGGTTRAVAVAFESGVGDVRATVAYTVGFTTFSSTEANITNGALHKLIGSGEVFRNGTREFRKKDDGATVGPVLDLIRESASPAANDRISAVRLIGNTSTGAEAVYAQVEGEIVSGTNGAEYGRAYLRTIQNGTLADRGYVGAGHVMGAPTGGDKGAGSYNGERVFEMGRGVWTVLAASAVAVSHTGDTNETTLATVTVPAGAMLANGMLRVRGLWTCTENANNKTIRVRFGGTGGTVVQTLVMTSIEQVQLDSIIHNVNNVAVQKFYGGTLSFSTSTASVGAAAINTANAADLVFRGLLATGTDTITLESYVVEVFSQA